MERFKGFANVAVGKALIFGFVRVRSQVDHMTKLWTCPFCITRNHFPPHYAENISDTNLPAELVPQFTTVEYELQTMQHGMPPVFLFCVDICLPEVSAGVLCKRSSPETQPTYLLLDRTRLNT